MSVHTDGLHVPIEIKPYSKFFSDSKFGNKEKAFKKREVFKNQISKIKKDRENQELSVLIRGIKLENYALAQAIRKQRME